MAYGTVLTPVLALSSGIVRPSSAAALTNSFANTENELLIVNNGSGAPINVTVYVMTTVDGLAVTNRVIAVAAGAEKVIGPFKKSIYNDSDGSVRFDISAITTVTVGVVKMPA